MKMLAPVPLNSSPPVPSASSAVDVPLHTLMYFAKGDRLMTAKMS
jgi:hypothetical protein